MAFDLETTVPWGRSLQEYKNMFNLTEYDLDKRIISFGDGPAGFNCEMTELKKKVISIDPVYGFSDTDLRYRIEQTKDVVIEQIKRNFENFVWRDIRSIQELEDVRLAAMDKFLKDFEVGKSEYRYINHEMPNTTSYGSLSFDLALSSHFLILYSRLGLPFHIATIKEMLRVANEVRIFPILDLDAKRSQVLDGIIMHFETDFKVSVENVRYEFQKNGNEMLKIGRKS